MGCSFNKPRGKKEKYFSPYFHTLSDQSGKTVVITGTTLGGTGYFAALYAAKKGAKVYLLNRPSDRSRDSFLSLKASVPNGDFTCINCDLMDFASVRSAASELKALSPDGIDCLANNAGIMAFPETKSKDGYDCQMATNHLSHFILTKELMPLLELVATAKGDARVIQMSSEARKGGDLEAKYFGKEEPLGGESIGSKMERYHQTKLANILFSNALNDKLAQTGSKVKSYCAHPGLATTNLQVSTAQNAGCCVGCLCNCMFDCVTSQSPEDGAVGIFMCMFEPDLEPGGIYGPHPTWTHGPAVHLPSAQDVPVCNKEESKALLWSLSEQACGPFDLGSAAVVQA